MVEKEFNDIFNPFPIRMDFINKAEYCTLSFKSSNFNNFRKDELFSMILKNIKLDDFQKRSHYAVTYELVNIYKYRKYFINYKNSNKIIIDNKDFEIYLGVYSGYLEFNSFKELNEYVNGELKIITEVNTYEVFLRKKRIQNILNS